MGNDSDKIRITVVEGSEADRLLAQKAEREGREREMMLGALAEARGRGQTLHSVVDMNRFLLGVLGEPIPPYLKPEDFPHAKEGQTVLEGIMIFEMAGNTGLEMDCEGIVTDDGQKHYDNNLFHHDSQSNDLFPGMRVRVIRSGSGFRVEKIEQ